MTDEPAADLFTDNPIAEPLTYPGRIPDTSGVLIDTSFRPLRPVTGAEPERWQVSSTPLRVVMEQHGGSPFSERVPVVAVGSNAAPSQILRKFSTRSARPVVPVTLAAVSNLLPGVSAHVSKPGYIPAVPVRLPGVVSRLFVLWLDSAQLHILDETEPNYWRRRLPAESFSVRLESGVTHSGCFLYVGKHGCLVNADGKPRRVTDQRILIQELLDASARLRELCGRSPEEFVTRAQDPEIRAAAQRIFVAERWVSRQVGLSQLPDSLSTRTSAGRQPGAQGPASAPGRLGRSGPVRRGV